MTTQIASIHNEILKGAGAVQRRGGALNIKHVESKPCMTAENRR